jgi:cytidylate kinase
MKPKEDDPRNHITKFHEIGFALFRDFVDRSETLLKEEVANCVTEVAAVTQIRAEISTRLAFA